MLAGYGRRPELGEATVGLRDRRRESRVEKELKAAAGEVAARRAALEEVVALLDGTFELACPLVLRREERAFGVVRSAGLFEPRLGPQRRVAPTVVDHGVATITTQRIVFQGVRRNQEWPFSKLDELQQDQPDRT